MKEKILIYKRFLRGIFYGTKNLILRMPNKTSLKPQKIWLEATDKCNSRCTHCSIWNKKSTENPLSPAEIEKIFKDPIFSELEYVIISGGEVVLRPDIVDFYLAIHRALPNTQLHLSTNGIAADRILKVVNEVISHGIFLKIGISVDGIGEKHDKVRGIKGNFESVDRLLRELIAIKEKTNKISLVIGYTLSKLTIDSFQEVKEYADKLGIGVITQWYNESPFYDNTGRDLTNKKDLNKRMLNIVKSLTPHPLNDLWINWLKKGSMKFKCFAGYTFCVLRCNGDLVPCLSLWDNKIGNVREKSPTEIWNSAMAQETRRCVKKCPGCLNSWAVGWSFEYSFFPKLLFNIRHPGLIFKKITGKFYRQQ